MTSSKRSSSPSETDPLVPSPRVSSQSAGFESPASKRRSCTDFLWLVLFLIYTIGMLTLGFTSWNGHMIQQSWKSIYSSSSDNSKSTIIDYSGKPCTQDRELAVVTKEPLSYPSQGYLYFPDPSVPTFGICVQFCPNENNIRFAATLPVLVDNNTAQEQKIWFQTYATAPTPSRYCLPITNATNTATPQLVIPKLSDSWGRWITSLNSECWTAIFSGAAVAIIVSLLYVMSLSYGGGGVVPISLLLIQASLIYIGYLEWRKPDIVDSNRTTARTVAAVLTWLLAAGFFALSMYFIRRVWAAWSFVKYSSRALSQFKNSANVLTYVLPTIQVLILIGILCWGMIVLGFIFTAGKTRQVFQSVHGASLNSSITSVSVAIEAFELDTSLRWMAIYHTFGLYWWCESLSYVGQMIISLSMALWYFNPEALSSSSSVVTSPETPMLSDDDDEDESSDGSAATSSTVNPVNFSIRTTMLYHLGTCALSGLIVSPLLYFRSFFMWVQANATSHESCFSVLAKACCCCIRFSETCLKAISREVYILTGIHGTNYRKSSNAAYNLSQARLLREGSFEVVGQASVFLGKTIVTIASTYTCYRVLPNESSTFFLPMLVTLWFSYFTAHTFLAVYEISINTMLVAFAIDEEMHGGINQASFAPSSLIRLIDENLRPQWQEI